MASSFPSLHNLLSSPLRRQSSFPFSANGASFQPIPPSIAFISSPLLLSSPQPPSRIASHPIAVKASSSSSSSSSSPAIVAESSGIKIDLIPTKPIEGQKTGTSGLRKKVKIFKQENYLANWIQALFNSLPPEDYKNRLLVLGGDGRYFNKEAAQIIIKIAAGNGVGKILVGKEGILSTPAVSAVIRKRKANGGFIMSASHNPGGPEYDWGIKFNYSSGQPAPESITDKIYGNTLSKKKHHQLRRVICGRCRLLSHGHMITAVGGNGGYSGGKQFIMAEQLRDKLSHLRYEKALIVKLVDIVDFNGSFLARVRDLAGANPIILVVTKVDLLPKGTDLNCIGDWVVEATTKKKLSVLSVHLTSSKSLVGVAGVVADIQKEKKGRDVYILGSANVGKSAFINALLKKMAERDPVAAAAEKYRPIQSAVPGTTLGPIQIDAFLGGGKLYDTPGVHLHHRLAAVVHSEDLPALAPQSRLRGQSFQVHQLPTDNEMGSKDLSSGLNGFSIFWGGLVRVDLLKVQPETCLTFYGPKGLQIHMVPTEKANEFYEKELGVSLTPPSGKQTTVGWRGLETMRQLKINFEDEQRPACDVAISGLGWIAVERKKSLQNTLSDLESSVDELELAVHVPKPVELFVRPPMPVGKAGAEWYQYRDLTEEEEEVRPRWYL